MRIQAADEKLIIHIGEFLKNYLPNVRKRDPDTINSYRISISLFHSYMEEQYGITISKIKSSDYSQNNLVQWKEWLINNRGNVATTVNHRMSDLRGLCKFLNKKGIITNLDFEEIREINVEIDERVIEFTWLSVNEVNSILNASSNAKNGMRDHFLLSLLYETGARIDELLSLTIGDFRPADTGAGEVHFFGKGAKPRDTPVSSEIFNQLEIYLNKYHPVRNKDNLVFYTHYDGKNKKMSQDNVSRILGNIEKEVKKTFAQLLHLHPHLFRRTRAMHLYESGVSLPIISEWLGHSRIESTKFYAQVTKNMKREALGKMSDNDSKVFNSETEFKYADDEEILKRLAGLA